ncbi:MAG: glucose-6-phosphate dehydrogenase [Verrucomicrobiota bacterium]
MAVPLNVVLVGASGDLAQRKVLPALFSLFAQRLLPSDVHIFGFARTALTDAEFRARTAEHLMCRYTPGVHECAAMTEQFLARCHYVTGEYGSAESFLDLAERIQQVTGGLTGDRLFYLATPPSVFLDVARAIGNSGLVTCDDTESWTRIVIEKPFGRDRASSDELVAEFGKVFTNEQTYRIDHYLGKEVIQNLLVLRFANRIFEPIWNREFIRQVRIVWKETLDIGNRGGYFDGFGIIRDVMQNHLMQMLALIAMEQPDSLAAMPIRDEKVQVLRAVRPLDLDDLVLGQYVASAGNIDGRKSYRQENGVAPDSRTPTYASAVLRVNNSRWKGVPFVIECGKALDEQLAEICIQFHDVPHNIFSGELLELPANELVIRIQPDEAIFVRVVNKVPGLKMRLEATELNLRYRTAFAGVIPEAYESLLLDVVAGERSLFIRADELAASWDVFDRVLHEIDDLQVTPESYQQGSRGPDGIARLNQKTGNEK